MPVLLPRMVISCAALQSESLPQMPQISSVSTKRP